MTVYNRTQLDDFLSTHVTAKTEDLIRSALDGSGLDPAAGSNQRIWVDAQDQAGTYGLGDYTGMHGSRDILGSLFVDLDTTPGDRMRVYTSGHAVVASGDGDETIVDLNKGTVGDTIVGGSGDARLYSGTPAGQAHVGNTLLGGSGMNSLYGAGGDVLKAYNGTGSLGNTLYGHGDTLYGGSGKDLLVAKDGNNSLIGGSGADTLRAGTGHDTLYAGTGHNTLVANNGDTLYASTIGSGTKADGIQDKLYATGSGNSITGGSHYDRIYGGNGSNNTLVGGSGRTDIVTGNGSQSITGGTGELHVYVKAGSNTDTITSGSGKNYFEFYNSGYFHESHTGSGANMVTTVTFSNTPNGAATQTVTINGDITKLIHPNSHT